MQATPLPIQSTESRKILLAALGLAILRSPLLLLHGRVMNEEGPIYFGPAWNGPAMSALMAPHMGYYSLFLNALTLFSARCLPLEWLGLALTTASLAVLLLTVYLAITCEALHDRQSRWLIAGIVLLTPAIEVWLTAEDVQFYLPVCVAFICISSEHRHRILRSVVLALGSLSGPASMVLTPFFLWRALRRRTAMAIVQAVILTLGTAVEGVTLLHSVHSGARPLSSLGKDAWFGPVLFVKIFSVSFFGRLGAFLAQRVIIAHATPPIAFLFWLLALLSLAVFWRMARQAGAAGITLFLMAMASLMFNYIGTAEPVETLFIGAFRYYFTGFVLLWSLPVFALSRSAKAPSSRLALALACVFLFWGTVDSIGYWKRFQARTPDWRREVAAWRSNPSTPVMVAPPSWKTPMYLRPGR